MGKVSKYAIIYDSHCDLDSLFVPDYEIKDGDVLTFGNTVIHCVMVPGHTDGCVALFFDARDAVLFVHCRSIPRASSSYRIKRGEFFWDFKGMANSFGYVEQRMGWVPDSLLS